jgi:ABC-2 type transport system permease protein
VIVGIADVRHAVAAEWTKFWSVRSTWWGLAGGAVLTVLSALTVAGDRATVAEAGAGLAAARFPASAPVLTATALAQFALAAVVLLTVTSEYASGSVRGTLQSIPIRGRLLAAKLSVSAVVMFAAAAVFGLAATLTTYAFLSLEPFDRAALLPPATVVTDLLRMGGYIALVALMTIGVGFAVRSADGSLSVVFMLLAGLPLLLAMTGNQVAIEVSMRTPTLAGLTFMGSTDPLTDGLPRYSALEALMWLLAWTAASVAAGFATLRRRDA